MCVRTIPPQGRHLYLHENKPMSLTSPSRSSERILKDVCALALTRGDVREEEDIQAAQRNANFPRPDPPSCGWNTLNISEGTAVI